MRFLVALMALLALAGCGGKGVTYDKAVEDLCAQISAQLRELPTMRSAECRYVHGLDLGQQLKVQAILKQEWVSDAAVAQAIDTAVRTFWSSPANVDNLAVDVYSAANPPTSDDDASNKDRQLGHKSIDTLNYTDTSRTYGPRGT